MRDRGRAHDELVIGERGVVADRVAVGERGDGVQEERTHGVARSPFGDGGVGGAQMGCGVETLGGDAVSHQDLATDALRQRTTQRREDEQDDRDAEPADRGPEHVRVDARAVQAGEEAQDQPSEQFEDVAGLCRSALADDVSQSRVGDRRIDRGSAKTRDEREARVDARDRRVDRLWARVERAGERRGLLRLSRRVVDIERLARRQRDAVRELQEETGVAGEVVRSIGVSVFVSARGEVEVTYFLMRFRSTAPSLESRQIQWTSFTEAKGLLTFSDAGRLLDAAERAVREEGL